MGEEGTGKSQKMKTTLPCTSPWVVTIEQDLLFEDEFWSQVWSNLVSAPASPSLGAAS